MKKKKIAAAAVSAVLFGVLAAAMSSVPKSLEDQNMAERWKSGETEYAQISVFFPQGRSSFKEQETEKLRSTIETKLKEASFRPENEGAEIWIDARSSVTTVSQASVYDEQTGSLQTAGSDYSVTGVGGNFFDFHPMRLISGNYIYEGELDDDRAVLDRQAAWDIFSSFDITGMKFVINGTEFEVAGVVDPGENRDVKTAYPASPMIYVHYSALEKAELDTTLQCYEAVIPDPVTNFARNIILENYGINTMSEEEDSEDPEKKLAAVIVQNTGRYSPLKLWKGLREFRNTAIQDRSIAYPYWENAARMTSVKMEILFAFSLLAAAVFLVTVISEICLLYAHRKWHLKDFLEDMMYKYTYKKRVSDYISTPSENGEGKYDQ
ncbi:ABC transporter permease [Ruminococcus sp. HUN007]|uniref:ABC transporter permease n=1 Tax=Ruminococcus sp. HUN007 TaxID=1514668 RepID=UPI0005D17B74|nr:ABC transporter permease [Ruminococcus sp. HUN007]